MSAAGTPHPGSGQCGAAGQKKRTRASNREGPSFLDGLKGSTVPTTRNGARPMENVRTRRTEHIWPRPMENIRARPMARFSPSEKRTRASNTERRRFAVDRASPMENIRARPMVPDSGPSEKRTRASNTERRRFAVDRWKTSGRCSTDGHPGATDGARFWPPRKANTRVQHGTSPLRHGL